MQQRNWLKLYDFLLNGILYQVPSIVQIQLLHQTCSMGLYGLDRKVQNFRDLPAGFAFCNEL